MKEGERPTPDEVADEAINKPLTQHLLNSTVEHTLFAIKDTPKPFRKRWASWELESIHTQRRRR